MTQTSPTPDPQAPTFPADGLPNLADLMERLTAIVAGETTALSERRPRLLETTADEKGRLVDAYADAVVRIKRKPDVLKNSDPVLRQRLSDATIQLDAAMHDHARKLVTVKSVTENIVQSVAREIQQRNRPATGYGRNGLLQSAIAGRFAGTRAAAVSYNNTI